jgi:hypothetical protein
LNEVGAFVRIHAFAGVMRAIIMQPDTTAPRREEIEDALARMMTAFAGKASERMIAPGNREMVPERRRR